MLHLQYQQSQSSHAVCSNLPFPFQPQAEKRHVTQRQQSPGIQHRSSNILDSAHIYTQRSCNTECCATTSGHLEQTNLHYLDTDVKLRPSEAKYSCSNLIKCCSTERQSKGLTIPQEYADVHFCRDSGTAAVAQNRPLYHYTAERLKLPSEFWGRLELATWERRESDNSSVQEATFGHLCKNSPFSLMCRLLFNKYHKFFSVLRRLSCLYVRVAGTWIFSRLINIDNPNYSPSGAQLYYEMSVGTPIQTCDHCLTYIYIYIYIYIVDRIAQSV
jgi:hypothetical protein